MGIHDRFVFHSGWPLLGRLQLRGEVGPVQCVPRPFRTRFLLRTLRAAARELVQPPPLKCRWNHYTRCPVAGTLGRPRTGASVKAAAAAVIAPSGEASGKAARVWVRESRIACGMPMRRKLQRIIQNALYRLLCHPMHR